MMYSKEADAFIHSLEYKDGWRSDCGLGLTMCTSGWMFNRIDVVHHGIACVAVATIDASFETGWYVSYSQQDHIMCLHSENITEVLYDEEAKLAVEITARKWFPEIPASLPYKRQRVIKRTIPLQHRWRR